jgi:rubrerythrin
VEVDMTSHQPYIDPTAGVRGEHDTAVPFADERALAAALREHGPREGEALAAYEALIADCDDEAVTYLAGLILDDERRHHRLMTEMLNQVESLLWETELTPQVPHLRTRVDPDLRAATDALLEIERDDAKELRRLKRQVKSQSDSSMLPLLVDLMVHDTAKHIAILELIRAHTKKR